MTTGKFLGIAFGAAALGLVLAGLFLKDAIPKAERQIAATPAIVQPEPPPVATSVEPMSVAEPPAAKLPETKVIASAGKKSSPPKAKSATPKEPVQDPDARAALSFVGADAGAETYWMAAINDASLPANERKDLIEDLNEDGLSDPKHPGAEDLPLILNRISLIEQLAPSAMDQVNADAFAEAYKDLVNLAAGGTPQ
jgi:hypothetical protein